MTNDQLDSTTATVDGWDVDTIRAQIPALAARQDGRSVAFLDGPAGAQMPASVIEAMVSYMTDRNANAEGAFKHSVETDELIEQARTAMADFVGGDPRGIAFGQNMTTLNFLLAHAVARTLSPGDEIVVTQLDHDANVAPWLKVAEDHDLRVREVPVDVVDGTIGIDAIAARVGERTKLIAFCLASNALGTVMPAREISDLAHSVGALAWGDGVHFAPHRRIDQAALGLDVLLCSPYKFFGPHAGVASLTPELAASLPADRVRPALQDPPGHRFETGTQSHESIAGVLAAVEYVASLGEGETRAARLDSAFERIERYELGLTRHLIEQVGQLAGARLLGVEDLDRLDERTPTFALTLDGVSPRKAAEAFAAAGINAWDGDYYALGVMRAYGLMESGGALRLGLLHYNTIEEVDRAVAVLRELLAR